MSSFSSLDTSASSIDSSCSSNSQAPTSLDEEKEELTCVIVHCSDDQLQGTADKKLTGTEYTLKLASAKHAQMFQVAINSWSPADGPLIIPVPLTAVTPYAMGKIVEYLNHHTEKDIAIAPHPLKSKNLKEAWSDPWDVDFIDAIFEAGTQGDTLMQVTLGANYLSINALMRLGCSKVSALIKGESRENVVKILGEKLGAHKKG